MLKLMKGSIIDSILNSLEDGACKMTNHEGHLYF